MKTKHRKQLFSWRSFCESLHIDGAFFGSVIFHNPPLPISVVSNHTLMVRGGVFHFGYRGHQKPYVSIDQKNMGFVGLCPVIPCHFC